jgi:hypothetical protein
LSRRIQLTAEQPWLRANQSLFPVDMEFLHSRKVDDNASVTDGVPCEAMTTSPQRDEQVLSASEIGRTFDIRFIGAAHNKTREAIELGVPDTPCSSVSLVGGADDRPVQP